MLAMRSIAISQTLIFCLVGLLAGILSDRERRERKKAERASVELGVVYQELRNNVEHLKRAARMSALGHMSAGLAHEIRNPLASIEGSASILLSDTGNESRRIEFVYDIIQRECRRLNRLVTNFLEFARPRAPEMWATDIRALIELTVNVVQQTAARHQIAFHIDVPIAIPKVECDPGADQASALELDPELRAGHAWPG